MKERERKQYRRKIKKKGEREQTDRENDKGSGICELKAFFVSHTHLKHISESVKEREREIERWWRDRNRKGKKVGESLLRLQSMLCVLHTPETY